MPKRRRTVFVLSSQSVIRALVSYRLQLLGFAPVCAESEIDFNDKLGNCSPAIFLIDLDSTTYDGMQLIEKLSSDEATSQIPVLCMSAEGDLVSAERAFRAGAKDFLVVPFDPIVLEEKTVKLIVLFKAQAQQKDRQSQAPLAMAQI